MNNQNKQTLDPDCAKPQLAVAFFFKVRPYIFDNRHFGFQNGLFRIVKDVKKQTYVYLFFDFTIMAFRILHDGIKLPPLKPIFIVIWAIIFNLLIIPVSIVTHIPFSYFEGAKYFFKNGMWATNVRFFNWINFLLMIFLLARMLFQSYC